MDNVSFNLKDLQPKKKSRINTQNCGTLTIGYDMSNKDHKDVSVLSVSKINDDGHVEIINVLIGKEAEELFKALTVPHETANNPAFGGLNIIK